MSNEIEIIETREEKTARYGTILFSNVKGKGWTFQYDSILTWYDFEDEDNEEFIGPKTLPDDVLESGEMIPSIEDMDDSEFYPTFEAAQHAMCSEMSNMYHMGTIAGFR